MVFALTFSAQPALAHIIKAGWITTYRTSDFCVKQTTELAHSDTYKGGHFTTGVWAETFSHSPTGYVACAVNFYTKHRLRMRGYKWTQNNEWGRCFEWPVKWTGKTWYEAWAKGNLVRGRRFISAPCKSGYYTNTSIGSSMHGSTWYGGRWIHLASHTSPYYHWLP